LLMKEVKSVTGVNKKALFSKLEEERWIVYDKNAAGKFTAGIRALVEFDSQLLDLGAMHCELAGGPVLRTKAYKQFIEEKTGKKFVEPSNDSDSDQEEGEGEDPCVKVKGEYLEEEDEEDEEEEKIAPARSPKDKRHRRTSKKPRAARDSSEDESDEDESDDSSAVRPNKKQRSRR